MTMLDLTWADRAACVGLPTEWFIPDDDATTAQRMAAATKALAVCALCPVRDECLVDDLARGSAHDPWGTRGGMTETRRRRLARSR